jgi:hypothetical protein
MKLLVVSFILFLFSCAEKVVYKTVAVPVRCQIPKVEEPEYIKPSSGASYTEILKALIENYRMCRIYSEELKKATEVCE